MITIAPNVFDTLPASDRALLEEVTFSALSQGRGAVLALLEERVFAGRVTYLAAPQFLPRVRLVLDLVDVLLHADNLGLQDVIEWTTAILDRADF